MDLEKNARIETHENVTIAYETANIGSRFLALLLDEIIIMGIIILSVLIAFFAVLGGGGEQMDPETGLPAGASLFTTLAVMMIVIFLVQNVYYIFFEMVMKGRSPGKKAAGFRHRRTDFLLHVADPEFSAASAYDSGRRIGGCTCRDL